MRSTPSSSRKMTNKVADTAQMLELLSEDTPAVAHELNELFRWYSNQRNSRLCQRAAAEKERSSTDNDRVLPAPARFTRRAKPASPEIKKSSSVSDYSSTSLVQSERQSCKSCEAKLDTYDAVLWKLMHFDCADCCQVGMSQMANLDEQLNEAS